MLPFRAFLLAISASNSSSRFPETTTTRVSSGWVASISMCLVIRRELHGASGTVGAKRERRRDVEVDGAVASHGNLFLRAPASPFRGDANAEPEPLVRPPGIGRLRIKSAEATV